MTAIRRYRDEDLLEGAAELVQHIHKLEDRIFTLRRQLEDARGNDRRPGMAEEALLMAKLWEGHDPYEEAGDDS